MKAEFLRKLFSIGNGAPDTPLQESIAEKNLVLGMLVSDDVEWTSAEIDYLELMLSGSSSIHDITAEEIINGDKALRLAARELLLSDAPVPYDNFANYDIAS